MSSAILCFSDSIPIMRIVLPLFTKTRWRVAFVKSLFLVKSCFIKCALSQYVYEGFPVFKVVAIPKAFPHGKEVGRGCDLEQPSLPPAR